MAAKHPWIRRVVGKQSEATILKHRRILEPSPDDLDDTELKELYDAVAEAKLEVAVNIAEPQPDFVVVPRCGVFTKKTTGQAVDSFRGQPDGKDAATWLQLFFPHGSRSATCSIDKYFRRFSIGLCGIWCLLMQEFYNQWIASGRDNDVVYKVVNGPALVPCDLMSDLDTLPSTHDAWVRYHEMADLRPRLQKT